MNDCPDYSTGGWLVQTAMLDRAKKCGKQAAKPLSIQWGPKEVQTSDRFAVPSRGVLRIEIVEACTEIPQGLDVRIPGGIHLPDGSVVELLRTWGDPNLESVLEYPFTAKTGELVTWNVYMMARGSLGFVPEKWTGNAGFWVERYSLTDRIYHCSHALCELPDFTKFVYRLTIKS